jgi:hypothetical protein
MDRRWLARCLAIDCPLRCGTCFIEPVSAVWVHPVAQVLRE